MNGNVYLCESSRRNKRLKVRRKFSVLVKDMMETHHMGKH